PSGDRRREHVAGGPQPHDRGRLAVPAWMSEQDTSGMSPTHTSMPSAQKLADVHSGAAQSSEPLLTWYPRQAVMLDAHSTHSGAPGAVQQPTMRSHQAFNTRLHALAPFSGVQQVAASLHT